MKPTTALLCAALTAATLTQAQEVKPAQSATAPAATALPMDKVSYFIGKNVGSSIMRQQEKVDLKEFAEGVKDALTSKKSASYSISSPAKASRLISTS
jgi:menaquinone-dependent protoporphyrinogen IX oxidase